MFPKINAADDAVPHAPKVEVMSEEEIDRYNLQNELRANARLIRRVENALEVCNYSRRGIRSRRLLAPFPSTLGGLWSASTSISEHWAVVPVALLLPI